MRSPLLALISIVAACGGDSSPVGDAAPGADSNGPGPDAAVADAATVDATPADAAPDLCGYLDLNYFYYQCGKGSYTLMRGWVHTTGSDQQCPGYFTIGDDPTHYPSQDAAAAGGLCTTTCVWTGFQAVSVLCEGGGRSGWEEWRAPGDGCQPIFITPDGVFEDIAVWREMYCPAPPGVR